MKSRFPLVEIRKLVDKASTPVDVDLDAEYVQIGIRSHGKGLFDKGAVSGKALGDKRVFWVEPDCFVVNIVFAWEQAVGKTSNADVGKIASHRFPMYRPKPGKADVDYLVYLFKTRLGKHLLTLASPGGAGRNKTLGQTEFSRIEIPCPPFAEQKHIAEILSTWDRAIETTEKLIANSEAQKKALMQQLLTGKKRLPGFSGEWQKMRLDQAAHVIVSNVDKKTDAAEQPVRLCNYMDVYRADQIKSDMPFMRATATPAQINKFGLKVGDVLITKDSETPEDIAIPSYVASTAADLVCGYHLAIIRPKKALNGQFLKFYFDHPHTRYFFSSRANGATRFGLTVDAIETAPILLPSIEEQTRISEVIGIAENKIGNLRPIVDALRQEKSALMQQLLTGKRRVKVKGEAQAA